MKSSHLIQALASLAMLRRQALLTLKNTKPARMKKRLK